MEKYRSKGVIYFGMLEAGYGCCAFLYWLIPAISNTNFARLFEPLVFYVLVFFLGVGMLRLWKFALMVNLCLVLLAALSFSNLFVRAIGGLLKEPGNARIIAASIGVSIPMMVLIGLFYFLAHPKVREQFK